MKTLRHLSRLLQLSTSVSRITLLLQFHRFLTFILTKTGFAWSSSPPILHRRGAHNIIREVGGPTPESKKGQHCGDISIIFFTDEMLTDILQFSIAKLTTTNLSEQYDLTLPSLKAYIAILYYRGINGDTRIPVSDLWSHNYSIFYRTVMSRNLFNVWTKVLRLDHPEIRSTRYPAYTFAAIRDLWYNWNNKL